MNNDLIALSDRGPRCEAGGFWIDAWSAVPVSVVTHAHSDHTARGCGRYIATPETCRLLRARLGEDIHTTELEYGRALSLGRANISLHPAGHVLGSAQVRVEAPGEPVWVVSGDYKTRPDATCAAYEPVACDVFVTECTFGLPVYQWPSDETLTAEINAWWRANRDADRTTVLLAYSLGKAQRVLSLLDPDIGPIGMHGSVAAMTRAYRACGVALPEAVHADAGTADRLRESGLIVAPPSAATPGWLRKFTGPAGVRVAMASGWMRIRGRRRWRGLDHGFALSDHADWPGLLDAIERTGAKRVGVTHGYTEPMARFLRERRGLETFTWATRYSGESDTEEAA